MPTDSEPNGLRRARLRRWIVVAAVLAIGSLLVEELADLERRAIGDVFGPVFFGIFVVSVLAVIALSIYLLATKARPIHDGR